MRDPDPDGDGCTLKREVVHRHDDLELFWDLPARELLGDEEVGPAGCVHEAKRVARVAWRQRDRNRDRFELLHRLGAGPDVEAVFVKALVVRAAEVTGDLAARLVELDGPDQRDRHVVAGLLGLAAP